jgi:hypothetical protein
LNIESDNTIPTIWQGACSNLSQSMKKLKYIAPILIAVACLGLQHAKANQVNYTLTTANDSGLGTGPFGTVHVDLTAGVATITFTAASGYLFVDGGAVAVNVNASSWTIGNFTSNGQSVSDDGAGNEDGFGNFNQKVSMQDSSNGASIISFTLTNGSGTWLSAANVLAFNTNNWLVAAHIQIQDGTGNTGFAAGPGGGSVPDGGTTVMLLGAALGALGMARRFLRS